MIIRGLLGQGSFCGNSMFATEDQKGVVGVLAPGLILLTENSSNANSSERKSFGACTLFPHFLQIISRPIWLFSHQKSPLDLDLTSRNHGVCRKRQPFRLELML